MAPSITRRGKFLARILVPLAVLAGLLGVAAAPAAATGSSLQPFSVVVAAGDTPPTGPIYCGQKGAPLFCLMPLVGEITYNGCGATGGNAEISLLNLNFGRAWRTISVFQDGELLFEEVGWVNAVSLKRLPYIGIPDGSYRFVVGWDNLTFASSRFKVACASQAGHVNPLA